MAVTIASSVAFNNTTVSPSFTLPSYTPALNDVIAVWTQANATATIFAIANWTNVQGGTTVNNGSTANMNMCHYHFVTSGEVSAATTSWTLTNLINGARSGDCFAVALRGVDITTPIDSFNIAFSATIVTPHVLAGLTGANLSSNSFVLSAVAKDGTGAYAAAPTGWTFQHATNVSHGAALVKLNTLTTAGTNVTAANITPSAGDEYCSITVAFAELIAGTASLVVGTGHPKYGSLIQM